MHRERGKIGGGRLIRRTQPKAQEKEPRNSKNGAVGEGYSTFGWLRGTYDAEQTQRTNRVMKSERKTPRKKKKGNLINNRFSGEKTWLLRGYRKGSQEERRTGRNVKISRLKKR